MFTSGWAVPARFYAFMVMALLTTTCVVWSQQATAQDQTVTPEQRKQIEAAKSAEELTTLGKQFMLSRKDAAARLCIERICEKDPKLLTDPQPQTGSKQWNDLWFAVRADLQAKKLDTKDAAGRLALGQWLKQGGSLAPARSYVVEAMRIDPNLPGARKLLAELEPPVSLDFRYALTKPVLLTEYDDTSVRVEAGRGSLLLVAPVRYRPADARFTLIPGAIKVTTDAGKIARVLGLLLTEEPPKPEARTTGSGAGLAVLPTPKPITPAPAPEPAALPTEFTNVLYERLQLDLKAGVPVLSWQNPMTSRAISTPDRTTGGTSGTGSGRSVGGTRSPFGGSTGGGTGARESLADKRGEMPPNGWLGLLIKFPEDATKLIVELPDTSPEMIDINLLNLIQQQQQQPQTGQPGQVSIADVLKMVIQSAADPSPANAQVALAWLGQSLETPQSTGQPQGQPADTTAMLALFAGTGHDSRRVRHAAFGGLMKYPQALPDDILEEYRENAPENAVLGMLDEIEAALASAAAERAIPGAAPPSAPTLTAEMPASLKKILETVPASTAPSNAFAVLSVCLNCKFPTVRQEALRIILADGTQQGLQILANLSKDARKTVATQIGQFKNDERKAAVLRLLLVNNPDSDTVLTLLAGCGELPIIVTSEDDPLLTALKSASLSAKAKAGLLALLARSNLSAIATSQSFSDLLSAVIDENKNNQEIKLRLLAMAASQMKLPYQSPIPRSSQSPGIASEPQAGGFEALLAKLIMDPKVKDTDNMTAKKGAILMVASGRVKGLKEEFLKSEDTDRCTGIIQALSETKELRNRDSLVYFLASALNHGDNKVLQAVLSRLAVIHREADEAQQWQINLAVRQGVDEAQLVKLSVHSEPDVSRQATALIKRTVGMNAQQADEFERSDSENARLDCLHHKVIAERTRNPVGQYGCLVLLDLETDLPANASGVTDPGRGQGAGTLTQTNIPLVSARVSIEKSGSTLRVLADGTEIAKLAGQADAAADPSAATGLDTLSVDAAELIGSAIKSPEARKLGLFGKVDMTALKRGLEQQKLDLKPEPLGGWAGEVSITAAANKSPDRPIRVAAAKVMLQPLKP